MDKLRATQPARDSVYAGAIWYTEMPWDTNQMELVLRKSLDMAKEAKKNKLGIWSK